MPEETLSETGICNQSLMLFGAPIINNITSSTVPAAKCRIVYYQTRDELATGHFWRFNADRAALTASTDTDPTGEWAYIFPLPADFLAMRSIYQEVGTRTKKTIYSYSIEGENLLLNENECLIRYTKKVIDPTKFSPLFVQYLVLELALKLYPSLAGAGSLGEKDRIERRAENVRARARAFDRSEQNTVGREDQKMWVDSRRVKNGGRILSRMGS